MAPTNWDNDWERSLRYSVETSKYACMETASHGSLEKSKYDANRIVFRLVCQSCVPSVSCLFCFFKFPDSGGFSFSILKKKKKCGIYQFYDDVLSVLYILTFY